MCDPSLTINQFENNRIKQKSFCIFAISTYNYLHEAEAIQSNN